MKNHHLNFGGIRGSPKFPALVSCTLVSRLSCGFGKVKALLLASENTLWHGKLL
jgi:hypothetical protein